MRLHRKGIQNMVKGYMGPGGLVWPLPQPRAWPSASVWLQPGSGLFFPRRVDVVICLSTTVRNDTLQEVKEHRVSLKCRKQLRVEELEMVMPGSTALVPGTTGQGSESWVKGEGKVEGFSHKRDG